MSDRLALYEATIGAAWNVQGDPGHEAFMSAAVEAFGVALPVAANTVVRGAGIAAFWLGPRSWLVLPAAGTAMNCDLFGAGRGAIFDVSASRVAYTLCGNDAPSALAKHCPLDFHDTRFPLGTCAQSLFGPVNALYYRHLKMQAFTILVGRSFARSVEHPLQQSIARYSYRDARADAGAGSQPFVAD